MTRGVLISIWCTFDYPYWPAIWVLFPYIRRVQPRITERLLMGRKESNLKKKHIIRRLGPFLGVKNFEFHYFVEFQKYEYFLCMKIFFWIFILGGGGGVITKLD